MGGKLNCYNLGSNGVNVDTNPVQLEDGELTKAQNAVHDPLGSTGSLRKRRGLIKINSIAAAGVIRGGTGIPLGVGGQQVGPGGTAPAAARTAYVGKATAATDVSSGWYITTNAFGTATANNGPANPVSRTKRANMAAPAIGRWQTNTPAGVQFNNRLYYAGDNYTLGTTAPEIRVWDGVTDRQLCTIPGFTNKVSTFVQTYAVMHMVAGGDGMLYLSTYGTGTGVTTYEGQVWQLDPESGTLVAIGARFTDCLPNALIWYLNRLWVGTYTGNSGTTLAKIYCIRPGIDTTWTLDFTSAASPGIHNFASFQGKLFATLEGGTAGTAALVKVRSTLGVWTTTETGSAVSTTTYLGAVVFKSNLYVSYYNETAAAATIRKYDGTSWSTAYTGVSSSITPFFFFQNNGTLYAVCCYGDAHLILTTTDGSSWVNTNANFNGADELIPIMATVLT